MEKNIGRLVKKASNQLGREFDQFAKPFDLTGMEKKVLIYRQVSQQDARQKSVYLTEKAQGLVEECRSYFRNQERELEKNFSEEDIAIFEKILKYYMKEK